ncbi:hypothetical protein HF521_008123 [Silurus meridionalis]|uniref:Ig-like domain-containing protein n=1 Tax=Silurus meridionalis TaxID=175797 RepID=A0A8T0AQE4_SILME|nr:hypothetical protein HF521_008123 [Silurus meridionalis]
MMKCLYFLSVVFHVAAGCELSSDNDWLHITSYKGRSVLLPCSCSDLHSKPQTFTWETYRTENWMKVLNDEHYRGRYQLFNNTSPANLSLLISDLREEDEGLYRCSTKKEHRDFSLYVKGCKLVNTGKSVEVTGFTGESVVLPCFCTDLQDDPKTIKWEFDFREIYPEQTGHHKNKLVNKNPSGTLSLLISDLTEEDQGFYCCNVQNDWTCVHLYVEVGKRETSIPSKEKDTTTPLSATSKTTQGENLQETTTNSPTASSSTTQDENLQETTTNSPTASSSTTQDENLQETTTNSPTASSSTTQDENLQETTTNSPTASSSTTQDKNLQETTTNSPTASSSTTQDENLQETTTNSPTASSSTTQDENLQERTTNERVSSTKKMVQDKPQTYSSLPLVLTFLLVLLLLIPGVVAFIWWDCKGRRSGEYVMNKGNLGCKGKQKDQIVSNGALYIALTDTCQSTDPH